MAPPEPVTPSKNRAQSDTAASRKQVDDIFIAFSDQYGLGLAIPPIIPGSPHKQRDTANPEWELYWRFFIHYNRGNHATILNIFRDRAIALCQKWVGTPTADWDVIPLITGLPKASTPTERHDLKRLLTIVLDENPPPRSSISLKKTNLLSGLSLTSPKQQYKQPLFASAPKRLSADGKGERLFKRTKSIGSETGGDHGLKGHNVTSDMNPDGATKNLHIQSRNILAQLNHELRTVSANTSRETLASSVDEVFSQSDLPLFASQVTNEVSSQEKRSFPSKATLDSGCVASSPFQAITGSVGVHDHHQDFHQNLNVEQLLHNTSPVLPYSDSCSTEETDLEQLDPLYPVLPVIEKPAVSRSSKLEERLQAVWPQIPPGLSEAPLPILWEIVRVAFHAETDICQLELQYDPGWKNQDLLWATLQSHAKLSQKPLPERSRPDAWQAAINNFQDQSHHVVMAASLDFRTKASGPFFQVKLQPLKLELSHRLSRRFGSDRFLEVLIPTLERSKLSGLDEQGIETIRRWIIDGFHYFLRRKWAPIYVRPFKDTKKSIKSDGPGIEPKKLVVMRDRLYLFAENGDDFYPAFPGQPPPRSEDRNSHTSLTRNGLLGWLLQTENDANTKQPYLKLFSRISLGLSRTHATIVLQPHQIRHRKSDKRSPTGNVMNDGIARMSSSLVNKIRIKLGLSHSPAGFQGRFGSAKGFWIRDVEDTGDQDWIETYPSQRKWDCDGIAEEHRTFEVRNEVKELKPAHLNTQFLPLLEHNAPKGKKLLMKQHIGSRLETYLQEQLEAQRAAMQDPRQFRLWAYQSGTSRQTERLRYGKVPFTAGLPKSKEDRMAFLLDGGFHPEKQKVLWDLAFDLRKEQCDELATRLNIRIGRSTYAYMVTDFLGILKEDEIHLGFSSAFQDEQSGFSETFLHGIDVLVARSPAHYVSDIQKVKAVFKPELGSLKDVIIFPTTGNVALAEKLSGGDYDGDMAWVCWDPSIVQNFDSAEVPPVPDLFKEGFFSKDTLTMKDLMEMHGDDATRAFFDKSLRFNLQPKFLGKVTTYKERLCYKTGSVGDESAVILSTALSHLVDQAKQGIEFTQKDFAALQRRVAGNNRDPGKPAYLSDRWSGDNPTHIIDYLKFSIAKPTIERELKALNESLSGSKQPPVYWDKDLTRLFDIFDETRRKEPGTRRKLILVPVMEKLNSDIDDLYGEFIRGAQSDDVSFEVKMNQLFDKWKKIAPDTKSSLGLLTLTQNGEGNPDYTPWALLKASALFKKYYNRGKGTFVWFMAGPQLQRLKAEAIAATSNDPVAAVTSKLYAALRPNPKFIQAAFAEQQGRISELAGDEDEDEDHEMSMENDA